jgi:lipopolysaccharide transport protein LptA
MFAVAGGGTLRAQNGTNGVPKTPAPAVPDAPAAKPPAPRAPTEITADRGDFDWAARQVIYRGHVRVDDPEMKLTSEWLISDLPQAGQRVNHIVAETNVVIDATDEKGQSVHATGSKAVYLYQVQGTATNETITLTGNPQLDNSQGTLTGDVIVWDRANNHLSATNPKMVFRQNLNSATADTNPPPAIVNHVDKIARPVQP